ncbi:MAG TPA: HAMP domain-containing sensor histidine kinase [Intrasporangium sp.]|uniref:sensor histidine kinase n=1 Tax=Intrasporangium sp. TaxID=1925024 RepID=UPI002D77EC1C|nr:HAMP domain-containing sensor histidine kinase [Intrasporangium sp.]HET7399389.1 HAMP domain-containing sensor histidine kinase [Intrasporangium sp.]
MTSTPSPEGHGTRGLATRLLIAQILVLLAGALTSWLVASSVGPGIFHEHLLRAGATHSPTEAQHVEEAFASALLVSLLVALVVSVVVALAVTWYFTARVQRSVAEVAAAGSEIADGRYDFRVPSPRLGAEFDQLARTINQLGQRLGAVEATRRRMLADLAHEIRTPLATIDAHLEAIEDGVRTLDEATLGVLRTSTTRLGRLARDMTAVSRAEEGQLEMRPALISPRALAETAVATAREAFEAKGLTLRLEVPPRPPVVSVDPERMGQVLGNLLDNAQRHTPAGGTVTLSVATPDPGWVQISVTDTGEGIAPDALAHVFDRFYQADTARNRTHGGSGIGLTISRAIVEAHGGGIFVHSAGEGTGAAFTVRLPARGD